MKKASLFKAYRELTKPRIMSLVLVTTTLGYYLGGRGIPSYLQLIFLLTGVALVCSGSSVLNNFIERDIDCKMLRTKNRSLPTGLIPPSHALNFGVLLVLSGLTILYWKINLLTAFLSLLTAFLYVLVYTPMKKISWLNTTIGSIPGAIPPLGGWVAATNHIDLGAWILFAILFLWQHPHFYAIAWMFKEDYKRAGFKMLPVVDPDGKSTFTQIFVYSLILIPVSLLPTLIGLSGFVYFTGTFISGILLFFIGQKLSRTKSLADAKNLLKATVYYLPILLILIVLDVNL